jgi:hypothetical protein
MDGNRGEVSREQLEAWAAQGRLYFHMSESELRRVQEELVRRRWSPLRFRFEPVVPSGGLYRALLIDAPR